MGNGALSPRPHQHLLLLVFLMKESLCDQGEADGISSHLLCISQDGCATWPSYPNSSRLEKEDLLEKMPPQTGLRQVPGAFS